MKKTSILILFTCFSILMVFQLNAQKWEKTVFEEAKASIKFPGEPEIIREALDDGAQRVQAKYQEGETMIYMLDIVEHTADLSTRDDLEQVSLDAFMENIGLTESVTEKFNVGKHEGIKATIPMKDNNVTIEYRVIIVGQQQFQIIVIMPDNSTNRKNVEKYFDSFKLLK